MKKLEIDLKGMRAEDASNLLVAALQDVDISFCSDGHAVLSVDDSKTDQEISNLCDFAEFEITPTCRDLPHRVERRVTKNAQDEVVAVEEVEPAHEVLTKKNGKLEKATKPEKKLETFKRNG